LDPASAEGRPKELLEAVKAALGATPNMTTTMARSVVLEGWLGLNGALQNGARGARDAKRIALAVAETNECSYCLSAHTYIGTNLARLEQEEIERARSFDSVRRDPRVRRAVLRTTGGVSDEDIDAARSSGLTDAELGDIVGHVGVNVRTNLFNRTFAVDVDFPVIEPRQHASAIPRGWSRRTPRIHTGAIGASAWSVATPFASSSCASGGGSSTTGYARSWGRSPGIGSRCDSNTSAAPRTVAGAEVTATSTGSSTRRPGSCAAATPASTTSASLPPSAA
jgi:AhpD family alkylhydroperoxidase